MNKLTALSKLANAYWHIAGEPTEATEILVSNFHYIRRSLRIEDLKPEPKCTEGYNPKGPTHF